VAVVAITGTAFAADLPSRRAPPVYVPPPIPVFSWTGFYIGGQVGYGFGEDRLNGALTHPHGVIGGGHLGYNFAGIPGFGLGTGGLVFGVEGDVDGSDYRDTIGAATLKNKIQGSARGRLGVAVDRALFYATGGAAFAGFDTTYAAPAFVAPSHTRVGWTVGGGVEYAVTTQWSLRAEYRYSDFGTFTDALARGTASRRETMQRAQVGFSYKFDTFVPAPVVARY
jgi:outer membrane immunogenic protein